MLVTKKCSICGAEFTFDDQIAVNMFVAPNSEGAKLYFNLWHFNVELCPNCGYASRDVSKCVNKQIIKDAKFQMIAENNTVRDLIAARPNKLEHYLRASLYYQSINDKLNASLCNLQAGDTIYGEMIYWKEYMLDDSTPVLAAKNKPIYDEFRSFADELFAEAIKGLKEYLRDNPNDANYIILLAGTLCDGDKMQRIQGVNMLNKLKAVPGLTMDQKKMVKFLIDMVRV